MIEIVSGNLLESKMQTHINTVNCVGVMGKGIALDFKNRYPAMFKDYARRCQNEEVILGEPYLFRQLFDPWVLNFPTKGHWRSRSRIEDIKDGLDYLARHAQSWGITSIAVPPLGCGNGQLLWEDVGPIIAQHMQTLHIPIEMYAPPGVPQWQLADDYLGVTALSR